jgi:hypothetical protein
MKILKQVDVVVLAFLEIETYEIAILKFDFTCIKSFNHTLDACSTLIVKRLFLQ